MTTRLAQISDPHLSPGKNYFQQNFDLVVDSVNAAKPDFVVDTGDISLDGADHDADLELAERSHRGIAAETRVVPGNHDVGDHPDVARRQPATAERLARYRRIVGEDFWTFDIPGWRLIGLNSLIIGSGLPGDDDQTEMVRQAVTSRGGRSLAVIMHKPLADERYDENLTSNRFLTRGPRDALLACLNGTSPQVVISGHVHQYRDTMMGDCRHIWAPATSFMISDPWQPGYGAKTVGYLMHEFDADGAHRHRLVGVRGIVHHDLAAIPDAYGDVRAWGPGNA